MEKTVCPAAQRRWYHPQVIPRILLISAHIGSEPTHSSQIPQQSSSNSLRNFACRQQSQITLSPAATRGGRIISPTVGLKRCTAGSGIPTSPKTLAFQRDRDEMTLLPDGRAPLCITCFRPPGASSGSVDPVGHIRRFNHEGMLRPTTSDQCKNLLSGKIQSFEQFLMETHRRCPMPFDDFLRSRKLLAENAIDSHH
jgi:hypothetical protein